MDLYKYFIKYVTYPLWMIKDRRENLYKYLYEYRQYNRLDIEKIKEKQNARLSKMLLHVYQNTQYYHDIFKNERLVGCDFRKPKEILKKLPLLTKEIIAKNTERIIAKNIDRKELSIDQTGGSTGTPLVFYRDKECFLKRRAQELFFDKWIGYEIGDKVAIFVAARHHPKGTEGIKRKIRNATGERLIAFDPYRIDEKYMGEFLSLMRKFRPKIIKCFPNSLYVFAEFLKRKGVDDIRPEAVSCTGETMHEHQRKLFEDVFQCPVFEKYASFEVGVAACECEMHDGLHIFPDGVFFEFLNSNEEPAKPGELANIIVTDLFNHGFPLIRYKIGDVCIFTKDQCPCGSPLPLIKQVFGRDRDILIDEKGNPKPGYLFVEVFNKNNLPGQFQVIQETAKNVIVKVVKSARFTSAHEKLIFENFKILLGDKIEVKIDYVDNILREASGKYRYVHSMISPYSDIGENKEIA